MAENYLVHYGTKGQKWGERRYQNPDGSLTALGRIHYGIGKARDGVRVVINKSKRKVKTLQEEHKEKVEEKKAQNAEEEKQSVVRSGDASKILAYQDKLSTQELNDALNRVRANTALRDQAKRDADAADKEREDKKKHPMKTIGKLLDMGVNAIDHIDKYRNAFNKAKKWFDDDNDSDAITKMPIKDALDRIASGKATVEETAKAGKSLAFFKTAKDYVDSHKPPTTDSGNGGGKPEETTSTSSSETKTETTSSTSSGNAETKKETSKPAFEVSNSRSTLISDRRNYEINNEQKDKAWNNIQEIYDKIDRQKSYDARQARKTFREPLNDSEAVDIGEEIIKSLWGFGNELQHRGDFKIDVI